MEISFIEQLAEDPFMSSVKVRPELELTRKTLICMSTVLQNFNLLVLLTKRVYFPIELNQISIYEDINETSVYVFCQCPNGYRIHKYKIKKLELEMHSNAILSWKINNTVQRPCV